MFGFAERGLRVGMQAREAKIPQVAQATGVVTRTHDRGQTTTFENLEVMGAARGKGSRQDAFSGCVDHELCLLSMAFLSCPRMGVAAVMSPLFLGDVR